MFTTTSRASRDTGLDGNYWNRYQPRSTCLPKIFTDPPPRKRTSRRERSVSTSRTKRKKTDADLSPSKQRTPLQEISGSTNHLKRKKTVADSSPSKQCTSRRERSVSTSRTKRKKTVADSSPSKQRNPLQEISGSTNHLKRKKTFADSSPSKQCTSRRERSVSTSRTKRKKTVRKLNARKKHQKDALEKESKEKKKSVDTARSTHNIDFNNEVPMNDSPVEQNFIDGEDGFFLGATPLQFDVPLHDLPTMDDLFTSLEELEQGEAADFENLLDNLPESALVNRLDALLQEDAGNFGRFELLDDFPELLNRTIAQNEADLNEAH